MMSNKIKEILVGVVVIVFILAFVSGLVYVMMGKAGVARFKKNFESKWENGIEREIIIYNANGDIIFQQEGRFDFTYDSQCIEYIDAETGLKHNIFTGYNATVIINELE